MRLFVYAFLVVGVSACSDSPLSSSLPTGPTTPAVSEQSVMVRNVPATSVGSPIEVPWSELPPISQEAKEFVVNYNINILHQGSERGIVKSWEDFPIPIWGDSNVARQHLEIATNLWTRETDGLYTFRIVETELEAKLPIDHVWPPPPEEGVTDWSIACGTGRPSAFRNKGTITSGVVHLAFLVNSTCKSPTSSADYVPVVIAHEIGHALGLHGHTLNGDVMDGRSVFAELRLSKLTKEVAIWLRSVPPNTRPM